MKTDQQVRVNQSSLASVNHHIGIINLGAPDSRRRGLSICKVSVSADAR